MTTLSDTLARLPLWIRAIKVEYWPRDDAPVPSIADFYDRLASDANLHQKAEATIALIAALYFEQADESSFDTLPEFMTVLADMINGQASSAASAETVNPPA